MLDLRVAATVAAFALAGLPAAAGPAQADPVCVEDSWVAGTVELCDGELVYRDYVYDDYGADVPTTPQAGQSRTGSLSPTAGDARYATDVNSADLVELRLSVNDQNLDVSFELNALYSPSSTLAALAIDADDNRATGGGRWGSLNVSSTGWDVLHTFTAGDPSTNVISGTVPRPAGSTWRVQALTAVNGGPIMNVAFRGTNETTTAGAFWEDKQAAALGAGDISAFGATVEVGDMVNGVTRPAPAEPGFHQRVYTSAYTLPPGEGMSYTPISGRHGTTGNLCEQGFHYFGRYQPYGIYVPRRPGPHGMQLALHGCNANHASLVDQPGMQSNVGEALNRIVVVPLGRGPVGFYSDISERDVLDVMDDVERTYPIDVARVFAGGYSMGGYGTFRFAMLYPHRFAGYISWVGFTGDCVNNPVTEEPPFQCPSGAIGNVIDFSRNLRYVPGAMVYAGADELVHAHSAVAMLQELRSVDAAYVWYMHPVAEHLTFAIVDDWRKEGQYTRDFVRIANPARVTYRTDPGLAYPEWGIAHDRAYWVSQIVAPAPAYADVDLTSYGCGGPVDAYATSNSAGIDPVPWVADQRSVVGSVPLPQSNRLEGTLGNVASLRIDTADACIGSGALAYRISSSGSVTLSLSDGRTLALEGAGTHEGVLPA